jgi:ubiquinone/menaquinone biosynthesis C-methylase UbiE
MGIGASAIAWVDQERGCGGMSTGNLYSGRATRLFNVERLQELRPGEFLTRVVGVRKGMTCVDLGCGVGVFTLPMAKIVGGSGKVYAVDVSKEMIDYVVSQTPGSQVELVQADAAETGIGGNRANVCLAAFVLHEVASSARVLAEAYRVLAPAGVVAIMEWKMEAKRGPPAEVRIDRYRAEELLTGAGFAVDAYFDWSENHYAVTGQKPH